MLQLLKGFFAGKHLWTRDFLGSSDVAHVRHDSVPQSGHSGGGLSHTKGDDGHYFDRDDDDDIGNDDDEDDDDFAFLVENYIAPKIKKNIFFTIESIFNVRYLLA